MLALPKRISDPLRPAGSQNSGSANGSGGGESADLEGVARPRPKVSIMLITYNHEKYIAQALESVLMQETEYDYEINVIEDCSTDKTQEVVARYVEKYPGIVKPYFNAKNIGYKVTQKNTFRGLQTLTGDYFAILEGDDYWSSPHRLQTQVAFLEAHPDFAICAGNTVKIYEDGSREPHRYNYWGPQDDASLEDVIRLNPAFHNAGVLFRNVYRGSFPQYFASKRSCDIFFMIAHAQYGKVRHIDEDVAVYRAHGGGRFSTRSKIDEWVFDIDNLRSYYRWFHYRHGLAFCDSIIKYCRHVWAQSGKGEVPPLRFGQRVKILGLLARYRALRTVFRLVRGARNLPGEIATQVVSLVTRQGPAFTRQTKLAELPDLPDSFQWHLIWGLNATKVEGQEIAAGQPILHLIAIPNRDTHEASRHALCQCVSGFVPGRKYRVTAWVRPVTPATNVHIQLRDSNVGDTGKPAHEGDVRFNLSSCSVGMCRGDVIEPGIVQEHDNWVRLWLDFTTNDDLIYVYVGLLNRNSHVFQGEYQHLVFGGVEVCRASEVRDRAWDVRHFEASRAPIAARQKASSKFPVALSMTVVPKQKTELAALPPLHDAAEWCFLWGLNAATVKELQVIPGQPVLQLAATPDADPASQNRHAVCQCVSGLTPMSAYRLSFWVKPLSGADIHIQLRDSNVGETAKPVHEADVWFNLSSLSVPRCRGLVCGRGIEPELAGWLKVWVDFETADGKIYLYLGLTSRGTNSHTFAAKRECIMFGGVQVSAVADTLERRANAFMRAESPPLQLGASASVVP